MMGFLISYAMAAAIMGPLAARKNRNAWRWGLIGGLFLILGLLILAFMPYLCPKCKQSITHKEWKSRTCPQCGDISKETVNQVNSISKIPSTPEQREKDKKILIIAIVVALLIVSGFYVAMHLVAG